MAKLLLENGADLRGRDNSRGQIPLHGAVAAGDEDCVRLFLETDPSLVNEGAYSLPCYN